VRKFLYLVTVTAIVVSGVTFLAQSKFLATGAAAPGRAATISPLDIHASKDVSALPTEKTVDPF
jgi:hypothetical protein